MALTVLEIYMLGEIQIIWNGKNITESLSSKAIGILCLLSIDPEKSYSREKMIHYFWESSNGDAAKYNLRYALWSIRKILQMDEEEHHESIIVSTRDKCKINSKTKIITDVSNLGDILKAVNEKDEADYIDKLEQARKICIGEFLEGIYLKDCLEFNDWVFYMREKYQRMYLDILHRLSKAYSTGKNYGKAIEILKAMIRLNPLQEELYVEIIQVYIEMGDRKAALYQYQKCCDMLRDELNVPPMESTKEIYKRIIELEKESYYIKKELPVKIYDPEHIRIIHTDKENFKTLNQSIFHSNRCLEIYTRCYPIKGIHYYWMNELMGCILEKKEQFNLDKISTSSWIDLAMIHDGAWKFIGKDNAYAQYMREGDQIRIFSAMNDLLNSLKKDSKISIFIENFQWMDDISFEFFKYFSFKNPDFNGIWVISGDDKDKKFRALDEFIKIEEI